MSMKEKAPKRRSEEKYRTLRKEKLLGNSKKEVDGAKEIDKLKNFGSRNRGILMELLLSCFFIVHTAYKFKQKLRSVSNHRREVDLALEEAPKA